MRELRKRMIEKERQERELVRVILILICVELVIDCTKLPREIMQVHMILNCIELMIDCTKLPRGVNASAYDTELRRANDRLYKATKRDNASAL